MESLVSSPLLYNLALTLIHFLWQGCLIALVLKSLLTFTPYSKSQLRYTWSAMAMLANLVVPIITYIYIYQPNYHGILSPSGNVPAMSSGTSFIQPESIIWYQEFFSTLPYVSLIWISIVALLASKLIIELYNVNQLPKLGAIVPDSELLTRFKSLSNSVGLAKAPRLIVSLKADIPMAIGWLKPVILIPASMLSGLTPAQLDMLMLHELAHIRRHDYLVNFLQTIVETLLFFHPAVKWVSKQMRNEREYCSDDIAVKISGNPVAYAHTLADTASICRNHRHHAIPNMAMAASGGDLKQRVVRLVDQHHCASNDNSGKFLASVLIIFSIIAVGIQPYLNNKIIDLTSGRVSLFQTASEFIQEKPIGEAILPATSMAQLLLQQDEAMNKRTTNIEPSQASLAKVVTQEENQQVLDKTVNTSQAKDSEKQTEDDSLINRLSYAATIERKANMVNEQPNELSVSTSTTSSQRSTFVEAKELSISDAAFKRTDSNGNNTTLANPYSDQVANLANEPIYDDLALDISREHTAFKNTKQSVVRKKPIYTITSLNKQPKAKPLPLRKSAEILASPDPRYPSTAKRKGIEMDVRVKFIIDKDGAVRDIEFEQKSRVSYFRSAIRSAMAKWRFLPAQYDGKPVESKMSKIFSFSLEK